MSNLKEMRQIFKWRFILNDLGVSLENEQKMLSSEIGILCLIVYNGYFKYYLILSLVSKA